MSTRPTQQKAKQMAHVKKVVVNMKNKAVSVFKNIASKNRGPGRPSTMR